MNSKQLSREEYRAVVALIEYMRREGAPDKEDPSDFPAYRDSNSFIRLADEARVARNLLLKKKE